MQILQFNADPLSNRTTVVLQGKEASTSVSIYAPAKATTGTSKERIKKDVLAFLDEAKLAIENA